MDNGIRASYEQLKRVEMMLTQARTRDDMRYIVATEGVNIGYKTLARLITGKFDPETVKPAQLREWNPSPDGREIAPDIAARLAADDFLPEGKRLLKHQIDGVEFLVTHSAALLADEMGLGKTIQTISALKILLQTGRIRRALVLVPRPLVGQWESEFLAWSPEIYVRRIQGNRAERQSQWHTGASVLLTGLETWRADCDNLTLEVREFDIVVIDEIQRLKEAGTGMAAAARKIHARYRWGLSGTPIENRIDDIVNIFNFLKPDLFEDESTPYQTEIVRQRIEPYLKRRRLSDSGIELPEKVEHELWLELSEEQQASYNTLFNSEQQALDVPGATRMHVLAAINRLKQLCNYDEKSSTSSKLDYLQAQLQKIVAYNQKALVFSQFPQKTLAVIQNQLNGYDSAIYHGGLSDREGEHLLSAFQKRASPKVLLISVKAGGVGHNLTKANHVFHFDHWWNPAVIKQATARAYRIGQERPVFIHSLFTRGTIEERIHAILARKQHLFNEVVDELSDATAFGQINNVDLFGLFDLKPPSRKTRKHNKQKDYVSTTPYADLKRVQENLETVETAAEVRRLANVYTSKIGNKAFCLLLGELSTPEKMRAVEYQEMLQGGETAFT